MDTSKAIYKILEVLDESLDDEEFDTKKVNHEAIGVSEYKWHKLIGIMQNEGFISGFTPVNSIGSSYAEYKMMSPTITFRGIMYLAENSNTAKIINAAKLLKDVIPMA